jgi:hypothetical protein
MREKWQTDEQDKYFPVNTNVNENGKMPLGSTVNSVSTSKSADRS